MKIVMFIVVALLAIALAVVLISSEEPKNTEINDVMDAKDKTSLEIQERLDEIERTAKEYEYSPKPREWIKSGPFQIDRGQYILGEKIFLVIEGLDLQDKGQVAFLRPLNDTYRSVYQTIPFDGAKKSQFNYYIQPQLAKNNGLCTIDDLVGGWMVVFRGTDYQSLEFEITDEILPGQQSTYEDVC